MIGYVGDDPPTFVARAGSENALPELAKPPCIFCLGTDTRQTEVRCVEVEAMDMDMDCSELTPSS